MFPKFYWGFADEDGSVDDETARYGDIFYWFWYNLSDSLQVGFSPTITYDARESSGNQWNVPIGLGLAKMVSGPSGMTRIEAAFEYSVVHEDDFGQRVLLKLNLSPIVPRPIQNPIFGGA